MRIIKVSDVVRSYLADSDYQYSSLYVVVNNRFVMMVDKLSEIKFMEVRELEKYETVQFVEDIKYGETTTNYASIIIIGKPF